MKLLTIRSFAPSLICLFVDSLIHSFSLIHSRIHSWFCIGRAPQVLSGITYMHRNKIVHRDLKPENLLLESKGKNAQIKIIDFGLSTHFEGQKKMRDKIGTAYYIAPEVLHGTYDEKCDVWSVGVILYILLSGCPPFYGSSEYEILKRVETGKYSFNLPQWKKVSEMAKDLIRRMLTYVPSMRITAREALEHEWVKSMTQNEAVSHDISNLEATMKNMRQFQASQKLAQAAAASSSSKAGAGGRMAAASISSSST
eukprot:GHVU01032605.1.p1 GENE.GHVU01032605.1~~GHVU01032605.1.p1  ORF type:complete len:255 (+),score=58.33 GHVU01032605.1:387-1151(+)